MANVRIVTDSTCDLSKEYLEKHNIVVIPLCIVLDDKSYFDKIDITTDEIIEWSNKNKTTPKTAAAGIESVMKYLQPLKDAGEEVIYIGISEDMSTTCNVVRLAASEIDYDDHVTVINSMNLSTGIGLLVLKAAELAEEGKSAEEIYEVINTDREKIRASFVVDVLTFLARGGRCSSTTALLAGTLQIRPRIDVKLGKMEVGQKYRGSYSKVIMKYAKELESELLKADKKRVFVTHSKIDPEIAKQVVDYVKGLNYFEDVIETDAGGVITSHCGPGTLGIIYSE